MSKRIERESFGPNEWLIDEMYRRYLDNPESVGETWQEFFADYEPVLERAAPQPDGGRRAEETEEMPAKLAAEAHKAPERTKEEKAPERPKEEPQAEPEEDVAVLRGADAVIAERMAESLGVPTATSVRMVPARLLEVNRNILNRYLARHQGGKVSFTHLIAFAVIRALTKMPGMNLTFALRDGKPAAVRHKHVNLGLAVDVRRADGTRTLMVPNIKSADTLEFNRFFAVYEEMIRKTQSGKLSPDDLSGTTVTITNPGTVGTVQSAPRLMAGQAAIIGVGAINYPAEYQAADPATLAEIGVSKVLTLTSTYDHRVIQGAESGEFLGRVHRLLLGEEGFYEEVFLSMGVPYVPARWHTDYNPPRDSIDSINKHARVLQLINMYRVRGHLIADLDPLDTKPPRLHPELDPLTYGLTIWDLDRTFLTGGLAGRDEMTLGEILALLRDGYCRTFSVEYMHSSEPAEKQWIQERVEGIAPELSPEDQRHILDKLNLADAFETFLHSKYVGHKRFSLEGAESLVVMLDAICDAAADGGLDETVIGMTHRGRLNVLANIIGKSYSQIFREFEGDIDPNTAQGSGDVKYHLGASGRHTSRAGNQMAVSVASNPSHLESVDPVVEGIVRAKQDLLDRGSEFPVLAVVVHGDAAFAGQGVVAETLSLSQLSGYRAGGSVHIVVDNQLGFTTGSDYGRSSTYATDVAKMVQAPIFHINGEDPEACVRAARLAFEFRQRFHKDVVIDMWCYRRWGHNEADEPAFTQPLMYAAIKERRPVRKLYTERLVNRGDLSVEEAEAILDDYRKRLQRAFDETPRESKPAAIERTRPPRPGHAPDTAVERGMLDAVLERITRVPAGFDLHPKLARWLEERATALERDAVDWSLGEALGFGTLLWEGTTVRLSGQDSRRGTFSQRHSVLVDQTTGEEYAPLKNLKEGQGRFFTLDSLLSEFAVLGFEYGYSVANPDALVLWEAQFGDFANEAQVVIDQFIAAAEDKWAQESGIVLLLPHGYEGQGPEHSSARTERFLQLCAGDNIKVAVPSTPAQFFHILRRQVLEGLRTPLVVMTPKSFLRLPAARSAAAEFTGAGFAEVLSDPQDPPAGSVDRLVFCQGKIFYELAERRGEKGAEGTALVRIEQPYPFPKDQIAAELNRYPNARPVWVQEEPENMGSWSFLDGRFRRLLGVDLDLVARPESASPATGSYTIHQAEQADLLGRALGG